jgi:hypothetical protein
MRYFEDFESFDKACTEPAKHLVVTVRAGEVTWSATAPVAALAAIQQNIADAESVGEFQLWLREKETIVVVPYNKITSIELSLVR